MEEVLPWDLWIKESLKSPRMIHALLHKGSEKRYIFGSITTCLIFIHKSCLGFSILTEKIRIP